MHETRATILSSAFYGNTAQLGGALRCLLADLTISDTIFSTNSALTEGGGIYVDGALRSDAANGAGAHYYTRVAYENNFAAQDAGGQLICLYNKDPGGAGPHNDTMVFTEVRMIDLI